MSSEVEPSCLKVDDKMFPLKMWKSKICFLEDVYLPYKGLLNLFLLFCY